MNKERSKVFAQRMREVFKSKPPHQPILGQNESDVAFSRSVFINSGNRSFRLPSLPKSFQGESKPKMNVDATTFLKEPPKASSNLSLDNERISNTNRDTKMPSTSVTSMVEGCSDSAQNPEFQTSPKVNELKEQNQNKTLGDFNLNLAHELWKDRGPCKCIEMTCCSKWAREGSTCNNNNLISTNNNLLIKSFPLEHAKPPLFSSVLKYAFGCESVNRNDFIILALGVHHYVRDVFNALDSNNKGYILYTDLQILANIMGKNLNDLDKSVRCSNKNSCCDNSCEIHLHFARFSELIYTLFGQETNINYLEKRSNSQLVNAVVNITRRNDSLNVLNKQLRELEKEYLTLTERNVRVFQTANQRPKKDRCKVIITKELPTKNCNVEDNKSICMENLKLQKIIVLQHQELQCLREVIEDLRVSLQNSDAENLSLRVREEKFQSHLNLDNFSERRTSSRSSSVTEDGADSIDRMIMNFPSADQLDMDSNECLLLSESSSIANALDKQTLSDSQSTLTQENSEKRMSNESLKSIESSNKIMSSSIPGTTVLAQVNKNLRPFYKQVEDEHSIDKEIQSVYEKLSEAKVELENTRKDLEASVAQIRIQNCVVGKHKQNLAEANKRYEQLSQENEKLRENNSFLQLSGEKNRIRMESLAENLAALKTEMANKEEKIANLSREIELLTAKREIHLKQLSETRHLISRSLVVAQKNESDLEILLRTPRRPGKDPPRLMNSAVSFVPLLRRTDCLNGGADPNNNKTWLKSVPVNRLEGTFSDSNSLNSFNQQISNVSRNSTTPVINDKNNSHYCSAKNSSPRIICYEETSSYKDRKRLNASLSDGKRSKFNDKKHVSFEGDMKDDQSEINSPNDGPHTVSSFLPPSEHEGPELSATFPFREKDPISMTSYNEEKPTLEVKPHLIKPIAITKPLPKEVDLSHPPKTSLISLRLSGVSRCKEPHFDETEPMRKGIIPLDPPISELKGKETFSIDGRSKTSTQILENLEAEVESLRRSLEDSSVG